MIHIHCCCLNEAKFRFFQLMSLTRKHIEDPVAGARMSGRLEAETPQAGSLVLVSYSQAGIPVLPIASHQDMQVPCLLGFVSSPLCSTLIVSVSVLLVLHDQSSAKSLACRQAPSTKSSKHVDAIPSELFSVCRGMCDSFDVHLTCFMLPIASVPPSHQVYLVF